jgi:hypothetical protein
MPTALVISLPLAFTPDTCLIQPANRTVVNKTKNMTTPPTRRLLVTLLAFAITPVSLTLGAADSQAPTASRWRIGTPIVTYWAGPGYDTSSRLTDASAKQMVDVGMNLAWAGSLAELEVARRNGLRAMYVDRSLLLPASLDDPALRQRLDALVDSVRNHPALYAYHLVDEPGASKFAGLARIVEYLRRRDPAHLAYIDLYPNYADDASYGTKGYDAYLDSFIRTVKPSLLSYDHYQFMETSDTGLYLKNLAEVGQKAKSAGVPFMNIVQAAQWKGTRLPTADQERFLAYTTMAYGAQGISYFVWCWPGSQGGIMRPEGKPTAIYNVLKATNREFVAIAKQYQSLKSIGAYLKGYRSGGLPPGTTQLPDHSPFDIREVSNDATYQDGIPLCGVLFGLYGANDASLADATHALVVNLDYTSAKTYSVAGPENLSVFNAATGVWTAVNDRRATLDLPPGGGKLVQATTPNVKP